jgi:acetylornithine aminotransferase
MGRTGHWLAHHAPHHLGDAVGADPAMAPDVVTLAKGLGGGVPIGAAVTFSAEVSSLLGPGQHGTTYGGNPLAAAAALATLHVITSDGLLERAREVGGVLADGVAGLRHPAVAGIRGEGMLRAIVLASPMAPAAAAAALDAGFVVNAVAPDALRLAPPLILDDDQARRFVEALPDILATAGGREAGA